MFFFNSSAGILRISTNIFFHIHVSIIGSLLRLFHHSIIAQHRRAASAETSSCKQRIKHGWRYFCDAVGWLFVWPPPISFYPPRKSRYKSLWLFADDKYDPTIYVPCVCVCVWFTLSTIKIYKCMWYIYDTTLIAHLNVCFLYSDR